MTSTEKFATISPPYRTGGGGKDIPIFNFKIFLEIFWKFFYIFFNIASSNLSKTFQILLTSSQSCDTIVFMKFELIITDTKGNKRKFDLYKVHDTRKRKKCYQQLSEDLREMKVDIGKAMLGFCQDEMKIAFRKIDWNSGKLS